MSKKAVGCIIAILIGCLAGCGSAQPSETAAPSPSDIKVACEQAVLKFADNGPIQFVKIITADEEDEGLSQTHLGDYVFEDDRYQYVVDSDRVYIQRIWTVSSEISSELRAGETRAETEEEAESIALEVYSKALSGFLLEDGGVQIKCQTPEETTYFIEINETVGGIQTGTFAGINISKSGNLLSAIFSLGDPENIERLINDGDKMISEDEAKQIALEEAVSRAVELNAENIRIDDSAPCEIMTLGDTTVWAVQFRYSKRGDDSYSGIVMVDAFSGEVYRFYLGA